MFTFIDCVIASLSNSLYAHAIRYVVHLLHDHISLNLFSTHIQSSYAHCLAFFLGGALPLAAGFLVAFSPTTSAVNLSNLSSNITHALSNISSDISSTLAKLSNDILRTLSNLLENVCSSFCGLVGLLPYMWKLPVFSPCPPPMRSISVK